MAGNSSVTVTIGAALAASFNSAFSAAERRISKFERNAKKAGRSADVALRPVTRQMVKIGDAADRIDTRVKAATASVRQLGTGSATAFGRVSKHLDSMGTGLGASEKRLNSFNKALARSRAISSGMGARTGRSAGAMPIGGGGGGRGVPRGRGGGGGGIGTAAAAMAGGGGGGGRRRGRGGRGGTGGPQNRTNRDALAHGMDSGVGHGIGSAISLKGYGSIVEDAGEMQRSRTAMTMAGIPENERSAADRYSADMSGKYKSFRQSTILDMITELRTVYGDTQTAMSNLEPALKGAAVMKGALKDKQTAEDSVNQLFTLMKSADLRNITDNPQDTQKFIEQAAKVSAVTRGRVKPQDFYQAIKYLKSSGQTFNSDFMYAMASMMQEGSPSTVGTALASMSQAVIGGKTTKTAAKGFTDLGLVDKSKMDLNAEGDVKRMKAGSMQGSDLFQRNPYEWVRSVLMPALTKKGFDTPEKQSTKLAELFGNRNAEWIAKTMTNARPIDRDIAQFKQALGLDDMFGLLNKEDLATGMAKFVEQFHNFTTALGGPAVGQATKALESISNVFNSMSEFTAANPATAANITAALAGVGVVLATLAAIKVGAALAAVGPVGIVMAGIAGALATWASLDWDSFSSAIEKASKIAGKVADAVGLGTKTPDDLDKDIGREKAARTATQKALDGYQTPQTPFEKQAAGNLKKRMDAHNATLARLEKSRASAIAADAAEITPLKPAFLAGGDAGGSASASGDASVQAKGRRRGVKPTPTAAPASAAEPVKDGASVKVAGPVTLGAPVSVGNTVNVQAAGTMAVTDAAAVAAIQGLSSGIQGIIAAVNGVTAAVNAKEFKVDMGGLISAVRGAAAAGAKSAGGGSDRGSQSD